MLNPDQFKNLIRKDRDQGINVSHAKPPGKAKTDTGLMVPYKGKRRRDGKVQ